MKTKVIGFTAAVSALVLSAVAILCALYGTGNSGYASGIGGILYAVIALPLIGTLVLYILLKKQGISGAVSVKSNIPLYISQIILAAAFIAQAVSLYIAYAEPGVADGAFLLIGAVLAGLSAVAMISLAVAGFGKVENERLPYLYLAPIFYYAVHTLYVFKTYPTMLTVPLKCLHILSLLAILLFGLHCARSFVGIGKADKVIPFTGLAFAAVLIFNVCNIILNLFCEGTFAVALGANTAVDVAMLVFITVFALNLKQE